MIAQRKRLALEDSLDFQRKTKEDAYVATRRLKPDAFL